VLQRVWALQHRARSPQPARPIPAGVTTVGGRQILSASTAAEVGRPDCARRAHCRPWSIRARGNKTESENHVPAAAATLASLRKADDGWRCGMARPANATERRWWTVARGGEAAAAAAPQYSHSAHARG